MKLRCLLPALILGSTVITAPEAHAKIAWTHSYQSGVVQAQKSNRPIVINFTASWCPACVAMQRNTWTSREVEAFSSKFVMVKLDADVAQREFAAFGVDSIPATVFMSPRGQILGKVRGFQNPAELTGYMSQVLTYSAQTATVAAKPDVERPREVRVLQGGSAKRGITTASNWLELPGMTKVTKQKGYAGVYLLTENGATQLDAPVKKKPVPKIVKTKP